MLHISLRFTGKTTKCINLGSLNYLGFGEATSFTADAFRSALDQNGISTGNGRDYYGSCALHNELEKLTADFLGFEDAITFGMGKFML